MARANPLSLGVWHLTLTFALPGVGTTLHHPKGGGEGREGGGVDSESYTRGARASYPRPPESIAPMPGAPEDRGPVPRVSNHIALEAGAPMPTASYPRAGLSFLSCSPRS